MAVDQILKIFRRVFNLPLYLRFLMMNTSKAEDSDCQIKLFILREFPQSRNKIYTVRPQKSDAIRIISELPKLLSEKWSLDLLKLLCSIK